MIIIMMMIIITIIKIIAIVIAMVCRAGLAGLRFGYALGHPDIVEFLLAIKQV